MLSAEDALLAIQELMDGVEWTPDTLQEIADVMEKAGYVIHDLKCRHSTRAEERICEAEQEERFADNQ